jgi:ribonuclease P protein component
MRHRAEFSAAVRGRRSAVPALVVHHRIAAEAHDVQVGFVVNRAVGTAVTRNRLRRRLRHAVRARLADLSPGTRLVVRVTPAAGRLPGTALVDQLDTALDRLLRRSAGVGRR